MELEGTCPYCGEPATLWIDESGGERQEYVEDCAVCCNPCTVVATIDGEGGGELVLRRQDD